MHQWQSHLKHLMMLHVHKDRTDALTLVDVANDFFAEKENRKQLFGKFSSNYFNHFMLATGLGLTVLCETKWNETTYKSGPLRFAKYSKPAKGDTMSRQQLLLCHYAVLFLRLHSTFAQQKRQKKNFITMTYRIKTLNLLILMIIHLYSAIHH